MPAFPYDSSSSSSSSRSSSMHTTTTSVSTCKKQQQQQQQQQQKSKKKSRSLLGVLLVAGSGLYMLSHSVTLAIHHHRSSSKSNSSDGDGDGDRYQQVVPMDTHASIKPGIVPAQHPRRLKPRSLHYQLQHSKVHATNRGRTVVDVVPTSTNNKDGASLSVPTAPVNMLQQIRQQRFHRINEERSTIHENEEEANHEGATDEADHAAPTATSQSSVDNSKYTEAHQSDPQEIVDPVGEEQDHEHDEAADHQLLRLTTTAKNSHQTPKAASLVKRLRTGNLLDRNMETNATTTTHRDKQKVLAKKRLVVTPLRDIHFTEDDPDGLQQRMQRRWNDTDCVMRGPSALPPKIHKQNGKSLIAPRSADNERPYTGVLLDAARHFFPIDWLYGLVDFLAVLGYDWIHFRIVDDQSFVVHLDCHPELAVAVHPSRRNEIYTAAEMRAWVQYAKSNGISILPEVNVPGHAGGWQGIPGMLFPCAEFICHAGVAMPLNVDNPLVLTVIENVLREVLDIFSTAPYLHLGGDELWMSKPCLRELQLKPSYADFERKLEDLLVQKLNYSTDKVIRWEQTNHGSDTGMESLTHTINKKRKKSDAKDDTQKEKAKAHRAGKITHWWISTPPNETETTGFVKEQPPFFISSDLYFDTSLDRDGWDIFDIAKRRFGRVKGVQPTAVLPATFELGPCSWNIRNVWGKLVAVAMAASDARIPAGSSVFMAEYLAICRNLGLSEDICSLQGKPAIPTEKWKMDHMALQDAWSATVCDRLTYAAHMLGMRYKDKLDSHADGMHTFVANNRAYEFQRVIDKAKRKLQEDLEQVRLKDQLMAVPLPKKTPIYPAHVYNYTGVMIDLAHNHFDIETMHRIIDAMSMLGFNLLHLRLVENEAFVIDLMEYRYLAKFGASYTEDEARVLVSYAAQRGVSIMPEINFLSNAGGWYKSGLLVECPHYICDVGGPIPMNVHKGRSISTLSVVSGTLLAIFNTSPFLHLGSFDQKAAEPCYREAYPLGELDMKKTFHDLETTMVGVFSNMAVGNNQILRYESSSDEDDSGRTLGGVTHFYQTTPVEGSFTSGPFFLSADVSMDAIGDDNAWEIYQHTRASYNSGATGVIVGTNRMDSDAWDSQNVLGRLIAIAAGLSSSSESMDELAFVGFYAKTCHTLGLAGDVCDSFGKPASSAATWETKRDSLESELQAERCKDMTHEGVSRFPRKAVFG